VVDCEDVLGLDASSEEDEVEEDIVGESDEGKNLDRGVVVVESVSREREREEFSNAEVLSVVDWLSSFFGACSL